MRRKWRYVLPLLLVMTGCVSGADTQPETIDIGQIQFDTSEKDVGLETMLSNISYDEKDGVVYLIPAGTSWIYYWDKESGVSGKLCGRPECEHEGVGCNAHTNGMNAGLQVYGEHVYFMIDNGVLMRMKLDGTEREIVRPFKKLIGTNGYWIIHRDKVYTTVVEQQVEEGERYDELYIYQYDLEGNEEGKLLLQQGRYEKLPTLTWRYKGDYAYFMVQSGGVGERSRQLYIYDIENDSLHKLIDVQKDKWLVMEYRVHEKEILLLEKSQATLRLIRYDLQSGEETEEFTYPNAYKYSAYLSADEEKIILDDFLQDPEARWVYLLNREGEVEGEWTLPPGDPMWIYDSTEEGFILYDRDRWEDDSDTIGYRLWQFPYDGGEAEIVLSLEVNFRS